MCCHARDVVMHFRFHQNPFGFFWSHGGRNLPFSITLAIGFYTLVQAVVRTKVLEMDTFYLGLKQNS